MTIVPFTVKAEKCASRRRRGNNHSRPKFRLITLHSLQADGEATALCPSVVERSTDFQYRLIRTAD